MSARKLDLSRYARPDLVKAVGRVANFFGDSIKSVVVPPLTLVGLTLFLTWFLPFTSTIVSVLFLLVGVVGSLLTGLSYGALKFTKLASHDLKLIITETLYLAHNLINDVSSYTKDPCAFPPLSDIVHSVVTTIIEPIMYGIFEEKFYGGALKYVTSPVLGLFDRWLTGLVSSMERRFAHSPQKKISSSSSPSKFNDEDQQHDSKSRHEAMATERNTGSQDVIAYRRERLFDALENVRKRTVPKIDSISKN